MQKINEIEDERQALIQIAYELTKLNTYLEKISISLIRIEDKQNKKEVDNEKRK